jgi:hypothetical protein
VRDATGHGHDATCDVAACPLLTTEGRIGNAYAFDGLDDLLRVPPAAVFDSSSSFTVTAWIARGSGNPDGCLIGKILGSDFGNSWQACVGASGLLTFYSSTIVNNVTIDHPQDSNLLAELQWYHIALWSDGGTKATYIGGLLVKSEELPCVFDQNPITIGGDIDSGMPTVLFRGRIDDVQIYNRALTPAELQALAEVK